jgi:hypothetical protein
MKKQLLVIIICILLFLMVLITIKVSADMQRPTFTEGDYWEYDIELYNEDLETIITGTSRIEIHNNMTITINDSQYNGRIVTDNTELIGNISNNTLNLSSNVIKYYREEDTSLMIYIKYSAIYGYSEIVYNYPFVGLYWPIKSGFSWERTAHRTYSDYTGSTSQEITFYYDCLGISDINTSAGLFTCYNIKIRSAKDDSNYTISYRSPDAGYFEVKSEEYQDGFLNRKMELKSYQYTSNLSIKEEDKEYNDNNDGKNKNIEKTNERETPGFEFIIYILSVSILLWLIKQKSIV